MSEDITAPHPNGGDEQFYHQGELAATKRMMLDTKVDGNKSIWAMTLETFGMADGSTSEAMCWLILFLMGSSC
jgi:hypothetical protein